MADNLGLVDPTIGGSFDTWGSLNDANMARINKAMGDILTLTDTSGTVVLTQDQSNNAAFKFTGSGSSLVTVSVIDDIARMWFVNNARASGSVKFQCADGVGTSVTLAAGDKRWLYSDGTDVIDASLATLAIASVSGLQAALDAKAALASPALTGTPTAPTASAGTDTTQIATTSFVKAAIDVVLGGVSAAFDTLSEIATDLGLKMVKTANLSDVADVATARSNLGLVIGTDVQAFDADTAKLDVEDQTVTGGARVTSKSLGTVTTGTLTLDPGDRPLQHCVNGGAFTLAPGSNTGSILLDITNNASAGAITTSGWTFVVGAFTTTDGDVFRCSASIGDGGSLLTIQALQ